MKYWLFLSKFLAHGRKLELEWHIDARNIEIMIINNHYLIKKTDKKNIMIIYLILYYLDVLLFLWSFFFWLILLLLLLSFVTCLLFWFSSSIFLLDLKLKYSLPLHQCSFLFLPMNITTTNVFLNNFHCTKYFLLTSDSDSSYHP